MKLRKGLFMLCAGLSLCACSSDDGNQFPEGKGKVIVRIVSPTSARAIADATIGNSGSTIPLTGEYTVKLFASSGDKTETFTPTQENQILTFENVTSPTKVTVSLNNGTNDYSGSSIETIAELSINNVPAYGETTDFSDITTTTTNDGTTIIYNVSVPMAIPIARLEIGTIKLETDPAQNTFSKLNVAGVYLDKLRNKGSKYSDNIFVCQATDRNDYQFGATSDQYGTGIKYIVGTAMNNDCDFKTATLPQADKVYAYNFYGATPGGTSAVGNPEFKIFFDKTKLTTDPESAGTVARYAMIKTFKKGGNEIKLENGKIYRIKDVELLDDNIVADEEGEAVVFNVEVTVEEAAWTIEDIEADWAQ